jgi:Flp pilus assembly protein TadB
MKKLVLIVALGLVATAAHAQTWQQDNQRRQEEMNRMWQQEEQNRNRVMQSGGQGQWHSDGSYSCRGLFNRCD